MAKSIAMERWVNGGGVTLRFRNEYDPAEKPPQIVSLDFVDVDNLLRALNEFKAHPSPFCLTATCPIHGNIENSETPARIDFLASILTEAVEGTGIGYWAEIRNYRWGEGGDGSLNDASAEVRACEWDRDDWRLVNLNTVRVGLERIAQDSFNISPNIRSIILDAVHDNDASNIDVHCADAIVQAGLLGVLVYG